MNNIEFSNTFDTLLNSYRFSKEFGETLSILNITLDEYEKSVLLTQAQDIVLNENFLVSNISEGFDNSSRKQVNFSSLITVKAPIRVEYYNLIGGLGLVSAVNIYTIQTVSGATESITKSSNTITITYISSSTMQSLNTKLALVVDDIYIISAGTLSEASATLDTEYTAELYDSRSFVYAMPQDIKFILNEKIINHENAYIICPIHYQEYDRLNSKAYSYPRKRQAWRLFTDSSKIDRLSEIITIADFEDYETKYKIRYIRKPRPIILANLGEGTFGEKLSIEGESSISQCEIDPSLHFDIVVKAVEMAFATMSPRIPSQELSRQQQQQQN